VVLSTVATYVQLISYGSGFLEAVWRTLIHGGSEFAAFQRNFHDRHDVPDRGWSLHWSLPVLCRVGGVEPVSLGVAFQVGEDLFGDQSVSFQVGMAVDLKE
jgi:hypothetical protein